MIFVTYLGGFLVAAGILIGSRRYFYPDTFLPGLTSAQVKAISALLIVLGIATASLPTIHGHWPKPPGNSGNIWTSVINMALGIAFAIHWNRHPEQVSPKVGPRLRFWLPAAMILGGAITLLLNFFS